jgi:hypothetical protein
MTQGVVAPQGDRRTMPTCTCSFVLLPRDGQVFRLGLLAGLSQDPGMKPHRHVQFILAAAFAAVVFAWLTPQQDVPVLGGLDAPVVFSVR